METRTSNLQGLTWLNFTKRFLAQPFHKPIRKIHTTRTDINLGPEFNNQYAQYVTDLQERMKLLAQQHSLPYLYLSTPAGTIMADTKVSDDFANFYQNEAAAITKAKEADARMSNVPIDVGDEGPCMVTDFTFGKTPDKIENGVLSKKGCPFCAIGARIVDDPKNSGKRVVKTFWFWENKTSSRADQFKAFLDYLENRMGLPREVRVNHSNPKELGDWYQSNNVALRYKCAEEKNANELNEGKRLDFYMSKDVIPATSDVAPPAATKTGAVITPPTSSPSTTSALFKKNDVVIYMEEKWRILDVYTEKLEIVNIDDPKMVKLVLMTAVQPTADDVPF